MSNSKSSEITKIIVIGAAGRMGSIITRLVMQSPDLELVGIVDKSAKLADLKDLAAKASEKPEELAQANPDAVLIDFTTAANALNSAKTAAAHKMPIVIGATGFDEAQKKELAELARLTPILCAANMSIGINVLLQYLPKLAAALGPNYDFEIMEIHHKHKIDAPGGTALLLAESLANSRGLDIDKTAVTARQGITGERTKNEIGVQALRGGDVVGIHSVYFLGPGEFIQITHHAESRENFAEGALRAAKWLVGKKAGKLYSMQDVIEQNN